MHNFQVRHLSTNIISAFENLSAADRQSQGIIKIVADEHPGYPCRSSLIDAAVGEELWAFNHLHHEVNSPYKASGPIFIRVNAEAAKIPQNKLPTLLTHRLLSLRIYDDKAMMIDARTVEGIILHETIQDIFTNAKARYIQVHNSGPGCYNCQIDRME